jgi:hypothetical protein
LRNGYSSDREVVSLQHSLNKLLECVSLPM